jgi:c-di-GMP-binding flagellar brake protein YcgR
MDFILRYEIYQFYKTISESFRPTPLEIIFIVAGIGIFAGTLIGVYRHQKKRSREHQLRYTRTLFDRAVQKAALGPEERGILRRIAEESPFGELKRHIILQRAAAFDEAAGKLIETGEIVPEEAAGIREKLAACCFVEHHGVATTKDLPAGLHVYMMEQGSAGFHGEIRLKTPDTLQIEPRDNELSFPEDTELTCYFKRSTDTFFFRAPVLSSGPGLIVLAHPQKIRKVQRRKFYRKEVRKQAVIQRNDGKYRRAAVLTDLGGGGATALDRDRLYKKGDSVFLTFSLPDYGEMKVSGRIVRTSQEGGRLHIRFDPMKEQVRDKIITHILKR